MPVSSIQTAQFGVNVIATLGLLPPGFQNAIPGSINLRLGGSFTFGTGPNQIDDAVSFRILPQIVPGGSVTLHLSNTLTDICNQANQTIAKIRGILIENLDATQDSTSGGASSISWGAAPVSCWTAILNNVGTYKINSGAWFAHYDPSSAGLAVATGANDEVLITNNDLVNSALVRFTLFTSSV